MGALVPVHWTHAIAATLRRRVIRPLRQQRSAASQDRDQQYKCFKTMHCLLVNTRIGGKSRIHIVPCAPARIVEPALIEEVSGAVRPSGPRERGDRVNLMLDFCQVPTFR